MEFSRWAQMSSGEIIDKMNSSRERGLSNKEAESRLNRYGPNVLREGRRVSPTKIFLAQFKDFMVLILIGATLISGMLGEYADAITIFAIVTLNAILGFFQEYKAEKSIQALKRMASPEANVVREGTEESISSELLVPGDIVLLEAGAKIPADLRLLETLQLEVEESALTGESVPVKKDAQQVPGKSDLAGQHNMAFLGTSVTRGRGKGIVVGTGMHTQMGEIAGLITEVEDTATPLQKRLAGVGKRLVLLCLVICLCVTIAGIMQGIPAYRMFLAGVSLAVAAIPEGMPAIVTVALAIGVQKMLRRNALVRRLPAVETLGCTTVICSDKTGTLTKNEITVKNFWMGGKTIALSGEGYDPKGHFSIQRKKISPKDFPDLMLLLKIAVLCNNSSLFKSGTKILGLFRSRSNESWSIKGDPTEGALLVAGAKAGIWREYIEENETRLWEIPFDSNRKRMSVVYRRNTDSYLYVKGAPDIILEKCSHYLQNGRSMPLTKEVRREIMEQNRLMGSKAMRVLAFAFRKLPPGTTSVDEDAETKLVFVGLSGMIDPPRPEVKMALQRCKTAGIRAVMITGDHPETAAAIAREIGLMPPGSEVLTGPELDRLTDSELMRRMETCSVYARVSPRHKMQIVRSLKKKGHIVAMTGDGVNDAPAVKEANIGISMGMTGTDVTKEASDMVLADDNFATIVSAVEEGRVIYDNIRKFIRYMLGCNIGEVLTMFMAMLLGLPLPLLPIQILFVNLCTDGLPAMALGLERGERDVMEQPPRPPNESVFARGLGRKIISRGIFIGAGSLTVFVLGMLLGEGDLVTARTMSLCTLICFQLFYVFECKSERVSLLQVDFFSNPYLIAAVFSSICLQLAVVYLPFMQAVFKTAPLNSFHWMVVLSVTGAATMLKIIYQLMIKPVARRIITVRV